MGILKRMTGKPAFVCLIVVFAAMTSVQSNSLGAEARAFIEDGQLFVSFDLQELLGSKIMEKRGIDFGVNRGYSGSQAARHMMGMYQANYAGGPGKK